MVHSKSLADAKNLVHPKFWWMPKPWRIQNLWRMLKTWRIRNLWRIPKPWRIPNLWGLQKCWRSRKSRWTHWGTALLFRHGRIWNCWLLSGLADGLVLLLADVLNHVHVHCTLQVRNGSPVSCFYGQTLSRTVPAACTGPPCFKIVKSLAQAQSLASAWSFTDFSQTIAVSISVYRRPIKKPKKNTNDHCHCPISVFILTTSN